MIWIEFMYNILTHLSNTNTFSHIITFLVAILSFSNCFCSYFLIGVCFTICTWRYLFILVSSFYHYLDFFQLFNLILSLFFFSIFSFFLSFGFFLWFCSCFGDFCITISVDINLSIHFNFHISSSSISIIPFLISSCSCLLFTSSCY